MKKIKAVPVTYVIKQSNVKLRLVALIPGEHGPGEGLCPLTAFPYIIRRPYSTRIGASSNFCDPRVRTSPITGAAILRRVQTKEGKKKCKPTSADDSPGQGRLD